jgi:uncharacterized protein (DUF1778 family)
MTGRAQYTLKGVTAETLDLMRKAAAHEGMKIGEWADKAIRHAAEASLANRRSIHERLVALEALL